MLSSQLSLPIKLRDDATFANYFCGNRHANNHKLLLIEALQNQLVGGQRYLYIHGNRHCGRSHLLQAACHSASKRNLPSVYLPLQNCRHYHASELLNGLDQLALVCLDDIQAIAGDDTWEEALFHLFNQLADRNVALLVSASCAVPYLNIQLTDLSSRLSSGVVYRVSSPDNEELLTILQWRAKRRGLLLTHEVGQFICHRCRRDMGTLMATLDRLDQASLAAQRRLTIPFVKSVMAW